MQNPPIITITLEGMKEQINHAFATHQLEMDRYVKEALENALSPENIRRIVDEHVKRSLEISLRREIEIFFTHGHGAVGLRTAVESRLKSELDKIFEED